MTATGSKAGTSVCNHTLRTVTITECRSPKIYFRQKQKKIHMQGYFGEWVVAKAQPVEAGTTYKLDEYSFSARFDDNFVKSELLNNKLADESMVCAVIAEMIESDAHDVKNVYAFMFYVAKGHAGFGISRDATYPVWVGAWDRESRTRPQGIHVLSRIE